MLCGASCECKPSAMLRVHNVEENDTLQEALSKVENVGNTPAKLLLITEK